METDDMVEVTKEDFFAYVNPRDIHPSNHFPDFTDWETRNRSLVGRSLPGWKDGGNPNVPKRWFLTKTAFALVDGKR